LSQPEVGEGLPQPPPAAQRAADHRVPFKSFERSAKRVGMDRQALCFVAAATQVLLVGFLDPRSLCLGVMEMRFELA
jgi:hypothetical protein